MISKSTVQFVTGLLSRVVASGQRNRKRTVPGFRPHGSAHRNDGMVQRRIKQNRKRGPPATRHWLGYKAGRRKGRGNRALVLKVAAPLVLSLKLPLARFTL